MKEVTSEKSKMWGYSIVRFGFYHYKQANGRELGWFLLGFLIENNISRFVLWMDLKVIKNF